MCCYEEKMNAIWPQNITGALNAPRVPDTGLRMFQAPHKNLQFNVFISNC